MCCIFHKSHCLTPGNATNKNVEGGKKQYIEKPEDGSTFYSLNVLARAFQTYKLGLWYCEEHGLLHCNAV
jgi:hypothetical protein